MDKQTQTLVAELVRLLEGGGAHVSFVQAIKGLPQEQRGKKVKNLPYTIWQIVEHIRIAQWDMVEFSKSSDHESPAWPDGYWPAETEPASDAEWRRSVKQIKADAEQFIELLNSTDMFKAIPHGDGQTLLREALQIADHNAYHTAEIIVLRRFLGSWD